METPHRDVAEHLTGQLHVDSAKGHKVAVHRRDELSELSTVLQRSDAVLDGRVDVADRRERLDDLAGLGAIVAGRSAPADAQPGRHQSERNRAAHRAPSHVRMTLEAPEGLPRPSTARTQRG